MNQFTAKQWIFLIHLCFWLLFTLIIYLVFSGILVGVQEVFIGVSVNVVVFIILVYVHLLYLLPRYFDKERYVAYSIGLFLLLLVTACMRFFIGWGLIKAVGSPIENDFTPTLFGSFFFGGTFLLLITIPLRLIENWFKRKALEKELKTHQLEAELRFLKAQVNPHFLFNALNNIYALSFTQSEKAPEMILKLSDMMSYMLYDCKSEQVRLEDEINYLKNYIDLQQLKKDGELNVDFQVFGDATGIQITPMLFIPFFENAFKHGSLEDIHSGWLKSQLNIQQEGLRFRISNSYRKHEKKHLKGGVGLENIKARLDLLFPKKHLLNISSDQGIFSVDLSINFDSHEV